MEPSNKTSEISGIYSNLIEVSVQPDGIVRLIFKDQIGGEAKERAHLVLTSDNARVLSELLQTILQANQVKQ